MKLVFLGPPGAGKGTIAVRITGILNAPHVSTGNIFREAIAAASPLGLKVKAVIDEGRLVDDGATIELVRKRLAQDDVKDSYILDGFPRTIAQAEALAGFSVVDRVINFDAPDSVVIERLSGRLVCRKCGFNWHKTFNPPEKDGVCGKCGGEIYTREDDRAEAVKKRLDVYREQTATLIEYYRKQGLLADIDASPDAGIVVENLRKLLQP
ncbi:MAG: adenylate kinase [Spirochaetaceae bacterium]|jgi:adenylate kinase|nr:adenylate kinase [Spirochaetaceae bacterium]